MANSVREEWDVVVVGAGISGLTAAYELLKRSPTLKVVVLEAKDRLGGRTLTLPLKTKNGAEDFWDLGGQWVCSTQTNILSLISELGLETYPQCIEGKKCMQIVSEKISHYQSTIPRLSLISLLELQFIISKLDNLAKEFPVANPYLYPDAEYLDSITGEQYINKYVHTAAAKRLLDIAVEATLGACLKNISALFLLTYVSSGGGVTRLVEATEGCAQQMKVKGGTQQISSLLAEKIGFDRVYLCQPVISVKEIDTSSGTYVEVETLTGDLYWSQRVIFAIPPTCCSNIEFSPPLPQLKKMLYRNMFVGNLLKFVATYEEAFWKKRGFSGEIVSDGHIEEGLCPEIGESPGYVVYDATTYYGSPALVGFIPAEISLQWKDKCKAPDRRVAILSVLAKCFGEEAAYPLDYFEKNWYDEPYNGGCPAGLLGPGNAKFYGSDFRTPFRFLHWAGTDTAIEWMGYMDGAVSAGRRSALEVLQHLKPDVLTEEEVSALKEQISQTIPPKKRFPYLLSFFGVGLVSIMLVFWKRNLIKLTF